ncbi:hypothetical protein [Priestia megaterium]|uniref:hypothetical protein n=1 Tax=Priestia megaterium TaxID=1404 RepID=UPI003F9E5F11
MREITLDSKKEFPMLEEIKQQEYLYWLDRYHKTKYEAFGHKETLQQIAKYQIDSSLKPIERMKKIKEHVNETLEKDSYYIDLLEYKEIYYNKLKDFCIEVRGEKIK